MNTIKFFHLVITVFFIVQLGACGGEISSSSVGDSSSSSGTSSDSETVVTEISLDGVETGDSVALSSASSVTDIVLADSGISVTGTGATVDGSTVTITVAGTYSLSGRLSDGQVVVDCEDEETVYLLLDGVDITNLTSAPLFVSEAEEVVIQLLDGTSNILEDSSSYVYEDDDDEPDAALFSKDDLTIAGTGSLTVYGNYNDAIKSKDGLIIAGGTLAVTSVDDGIMGKDYLTINGANITINADGDGLKSTNDDDSSVGYIYLEDVLIDIESGADGIQAESNLYVMSGDVTIESGGGSSVSIGDEDSAKGLKCGVALQIDDGTFEISSADDSLHSNETILINSGTFSLESADDGIHADTAININDGTFEIAQSYEGIESSSITLNGGDITIVADDDGINIAGGSDGSSGGSFNGSAGDALYIHGGTIIVDADGDGIDANGSIEMTGGTVLVHGPTSSGNGALDYDGSFTIDGGLLVAAGSAGMAQAPGSTSSQYSVKAGVGSRSSGTLFNLQTSAGSSVVSFAPRKTYQSVVVSSPDLSAGTSYRIYLGGSDSGSESGGLYTGGTYSAGTLYRSFTLSSMTTTVN